MSGRPCIPFYDRYAIGRSLRQLLRGLWIRYCVSIYDPFNTIFSLIVERACIQRSIHDIRVGRPLHKTFQLADGILSCAPISVG